MRTNCTLYRTVSLFGKRWSLLILIELAKNGGVRRFSELKVGVPGITAKLLSMRLKELEKAGLVERKVYATEAPLKCDYKLTESGKDLFKILQRLKTWGLKWRFGEKGCEGRACESCALPDE